MVRGAPPLFGLISLAALAAGCSSGGAGETASTAAGSAALDLAATCPGASDAIEPLKEIEIVDSSVTDPTKNGGLSANASAGPWTMAGLVGELAPFAADGTTPDVTGFVRALDAAIPNQLAGFSASPLTVSGLPLIGIANRIDLRDASSAGEARLLFGAGTNTIIFEYKLPFLQGDLDSATKWAAEWHKLSALPFGASFVQQLKALTDRFTRRQNGVAPALDQIRGAFFDHGWDLFEVHRDGAGYPVAGLVTNGPNVDVNRTRAISAFVEENLAVLGGPRASMLSMPASFTFQDQGQSQTVPFLGTFSRLSPATTWTTESGQTVSQVYGDAVGKAFAALDCGGCHQGNDGNVFQVAPTSSRPDGTDRLSLFMSDPSKPDDATSPPDELRRRKGDLQALLCGTSPVRVTFVVDGADFTEPGQDIEIVGDAPAIGAWSLTGGSLRLAATSYPTWSATVDLPRASSVTFKAVEVQGNTAIRWETGDNRVVQLPDAESFVIRGTFRK